MPYLLGLQELLLVVRVCSAPPSPSGSHGGSGRGAASLPLAGGDGEVEQVVEGDWRRLLSSAFFRSPRLEGLPSTRQLVGGNLPILAAHSKLMYVHGKGHQHSGFKTFIYI